LVSFINSEALHGHDQNALVNDPDDIIGKFARKYPQYRFAMTVEGLIGVDNPADEARIDDSIRIYSPYSLITDISLALKIDDLFFNNEFIIEYDRDWVIKTRRDDSLLSIQLTDSDMYRLIYSFLKSYADDLYHQVIAERTEKDLKLLEVRLEKENGRTMEVDISRYDEVIDLSKDYLDVLKPFLQDSGVRSVLLALKNYCSYYRVYEGFNS
jgi:hypothetical protein